MATLSRRALKGSRNFYRAILSSHTRKGNPGGFASEAVKRRRERYLKIVAGVSAATIGICGTVLYFSKKSLKASEMVIEIPSYPWSFNGFYTSFDHAALRRGWQVYKTVCSSCHSLQYLRLGDLVDVTHTQQEVKAIAAEYEVDDGPDAEGNYFKRPGKLNDRLPSPYPNEEAARFANSGAYPPDLTYMVEARPNGINYAFALLTGWMDAPAGVSMMDGQYFNPYFPGGVTGMAPMLFDGMLEYEDGTQATASQMAKDVVEFLSWTAAQEHDTRKLWAIKATGICLILGVTLAHFHRRIGSFYRSRQIAYIPREKPCPREKQQR